MVNFPASLDSLANPGATTKRNDVGFELHTVISTLNDIVEALEAKAGIGASTPVANSVNVGTVTGVSSWLVGLTNAYIAAGAAIAYSKLALASSIVSADIVDGTIVNGDIANSTLTAAKFAAGETFVKLGEVSGTGSSAVLEIASIPATYRSLEIEIDGARSSAATTVATARLTFETSPTAGAYNNQRMLGGATTVAGDENIGASDFINAGIMPGASSTANLTGSFNIKLPGYAGTSGFKTAICLNAGTSNIATGEMNTLMSAGFWESTAAIARVRVTLSTGNWPTTARMTIWGRP